MGGRRIMAKITIETEPRETQMILEMLIGRETQISKKIEVMGVTDMPEDLKSFLKGMGIEPKTKGSK